MGMAPVDHPGARWAPELLRLALAQLFPEIFSFQENLGIFFCKKRSLESLASILAVSLESGNSLKFTEIH